MNFSSDGLLFAHGSRNYPYLHLYRRSGEKSNKWVAILLSSTTATYSSAFTPAGDVLAQGIDSNPYINMYDTSSTDTIMPSDNYDVDSLVGMGTADGAIAQGETGTVEIIPIAGGN